VIVNALAGASAAVLTTAFLAMAIGESVFERRGFEMGGFEASNIIGYVAGMGLASLLGAVLGPIHAMLLMAFFPIMASIVSKPRKVRVRGGEIGRGLRDLLAIIPLWLSTTVLIGSIFALPRHLHRIEINLPGWLVERLGLANQGGVVYTGTSMIMIMLLGLLLILLAGRLSDRFGRIRALKVSATSIVLFLFLLSATYRDVLYFAPLLAPLAILSAMLAPTIIAVMGDLAYRRGYASGFYSTVLGLGLSVGQSIASVLIVVGGNYHP